LTKQKRKAKKEEKRKEKKRITAWAAVRGS
jgi:hypothetical protein